MKAKRLPRRCRQNKTREQNMTKDAAQLYDEFGEKYINEKDAYYSRYHVIRLETAYNLIIKHKQSGKLFDFGCGSGELLSLFSQKGNFTLYGCDISQKMVSLAQKKLQNKPNMVTVKQGGLSYFQELDPGFDVIVALNVLPYLTQKEEAIFFECARRLLTDDGVLLISHANLLFDIVTFNRYTIEFYEEVMLPILTCTEDEKKAILDLLKELLTDPNFPPKEGYAGLDNKQSERDLLNKRRVDPFTYHENIAEYEFVLAEMVPLNCFPFPPKILTTKTEWAIMQLNAHKRMPSQTLAKIFASQFQALCTKAH